MYEARQLGHPLLANAVTNDVSLGLEARFYLVSGSNMSGKSTLLRSIGINAVLAYAGAPVRAQSLRITPLSSTRQDLEEVDSAHRARARCSIGRVLRLQCSQSAAQQH
jgi:dsDNA-specific endonuclease/ATPase MutS2